MGEDGDDIEPYTSHRLCDIPGGYKCLSPVVQVQQFIWDNPQVGACVPVQTLHSRLSDYANTYL